MRQGEKEEEIRAAKTGDDRGQGRGWKGENEEERFEGRRIR